MLCNELLMMVQRAKSSRSTLDRIRAGFHVLLGIQLPSTCSFLVLMMERMLQKQPVADAQPTNRLIDRSTNAINNLYDLHQRAVPAHSMKVWDTRSTVPIITVNTRSQGTTKPTKGSKQEQESKLLAVQWGSGRTILGAGSDCKLHFHQFQDLSR
jgi:hypothetical protein